MRNHFSNHTFSTGCTCNPNGAEDGDECAHNPTGECHCKFGVIGRNCDKCENGYYGFGLSSKSGCRSKFLKWKNENTIPIPI